MIDETQQRFRQEDEARHRHAMKQAEAAAAQLRKVGPFHVRCSVGAAAASRGSPANHCRAFVLRRPTAVCRGGGGLHTEALAHGGAPRAVAHLRLWRALLAGADGGGVEGAAGSGPTQARGGGERDFAAAGRTAPVGPASQPRIASTAASRRRNARPACSMLACTLHGASTRHAAARSSLRKTAQRPRSRRSCASCAAPMPQPSMCAASTRASQRRRKPGRRLSRLGWPRRKRWPSRWSPRARPHARLLP